MGLTILLNLPLELMMDPSDIDVVSFYLSGLLPQRVSSFGSLFNFTKSKKPKEAGDAKRCSDCAYEPKCTWSAKKIYLDPLKSNDPVRVSRPKGHRSGMLIKSTHRHIGPSCSSTPTSWTLKTSQTRSTRPTTELAYTRQATMWSTIRL